MCVYYSERGQKKFTINRVLNWKSGFGSLIIVISLRILACHIVNICKTNDNLGNMVFGYINIFFQERKAEAFFQFIRIPSHICIFTYPSLNFPSYSR